MYHDSVGAAFELHGAIYALFRDLRNASALGYLVTDESPSTNPSGRKSVFSKGAIYWSDATGAVPVLGQIYLDYEALGEARAIGFPLHPARSIAGGLEQEFQVARMYHKSGQPNAHEVHGAILGKYLASGGTAVWGFPITHETDVRRGTLAIGKFSEFERCHDLLELVDRRVRGARRHPAEVPRSRRAGGEPRLPDFRRAGHPRRRGRPLQHLPERQPALVRRARPRSSSRGPSACASAGSTPRRAKAG